MLIIIVCILSGIIIGLILRQRFSMYIKKTITVLVWSLLFLLGLEIGHNPNVVNSISTIGLKAIVLAFLDVLGSAFAAWLLWHFVSKNQKKYTS